MKPTLVDNPFDDEVSGSPQVEMPDANPSRVSTYFGKKLMQVQANTSAKMLALNVAEMEKVQRLKALSIAPVAPDNSWVAGMGLDPDGVVGSAVNTAASLASGTGRVLGDVASLPVHGLGIVSEAAVPEAAKMAYGRSQQGKALPGDEAILNAPVNNRGVPARVMLEQAIAQRQYGQRVKEGVDISSVVQQDNREAMNGQLADGFQERWDKVTSGWDKVKKREFMSGSGDMISGLADLVGNAASVAMSNKMAATEYIAENIPQLAVGAVGKVGKVVLGASNVGYAMNEYQKGITNYQKANQGALPPEKLRREMAVRASLLAVAEHVSDMAQLGAGKVMGKLGTKGVTETTEAATRAGFMKSMLGVTKATAAGAVTEAATEGFQTAQEAAINKYNEFNVKEDATPLEIYQGATIGAIAGGGLSGGIKALQEAAKPAAKKDTPEVEPTSKPSKDKDALYKKAVAENTPEVFLNKEDKNYDPVLASGVLNTNAKKEGTTPETRQSNLEKTGTILESLMEERDRTQAKYSGVSEEGIQPIKDQLAVFQKKLDETSPDDTAAIERYTSAIELMEEQIASFAPDNKKSLQYANELSRLNRQIEQVQLNYDDQVNSNVEVPVQIDVDALVEKVITGQNETEVGDDIPVLTDVLAPPDGIPVLTDAIEPGNKEVPSGTTKAPIRPADTLLNLSMAAPDSITPENAKKLADSQESDLKPTEIAYLRAFSDARVAENALKDLNAVSQEVLYGSKPGVTSKTGHQGITQYRARIAAALQTGNTKLAESVLYQLERFNEDHANKFKAATTAIKQGLGTQIERDTKRNWHVSPVQQKVNDRKLRRNGGLAMNSQGLVDAIGMESKALQAVVQEMRQAITMKKEGKVSRVSATPNKNTLGKEGTSPVQSNPSVNKRPPSPTISTPRIVEERARPDITSGTALESEGKPEADVASNKGADDTGTTTTVTEPASPVAQVSKQDGVDGSPSVTTSPATTPVATVSEPVTPTSDVVRSGNENVQDGKVDVAIPDDFYRTQEATYKKWLPQEKRYVDVKGKASSALKLIRMDIQNLQDLITCMKG